MCSLGVRKEVVSRVAKKREGRRNREQHPQAMVLCRTCTICLDELIPDEKEPRKPLLFGHPFQQ